VVAVSSSLQTSSQTTAFGLITTCKTTKASETAEDALKQLRAQAGSAQVDSWIQECEALTLSNRQKEEAVRVRAVAAKNKWDCSDARRLFQELSKENTFYKKQATAEVKRLGDCGERLPRTDGPDKAMEYAADAFRTRDFTTAREIAWRFVLLENSIGERARKLIQDIEQIEIANDNLRQADRSMRAGLNADACSSLLRIQQGFPTFPYMSDVRTRLMGCPINQPSGLASLTASERQAKLEKHLETARRSLIDGNIELAGDSLAAARVLASTDSMVMQLSRELDVAKQARETLETGISLRRDGNYSDAIERFKNAASLQASTGIGGRAHFEIGVTLATEYFLKSGDRLRAAAQQEFRESSVNYSNPDFEYISPRIKELYEQAVKSGNVG